MPHRDGWRSLAAEAIAAERSHGAMFLWAAIVFACGAALWRMLPSDPSQWLLGAMAAGCALGALFSEGGRRTVLAASAVLAAGMLSAGLEADRRAITMLDSPIVTNITGRVLAREIDERGDWRYLIALSVTHDPTIGRPPERVRVLARSDHEEVPIGGLITGLARLSPPSGPAMPGTFDFAFNSYFAGIGAYGFFYGAPAPVGGDAGTEGFAAKLSEHVRDLRETVAFRIREVIPGDAGAVAAAMTVSDRRAISEETDEAFRETGLAHILSISGLHMSLAAALMFTGLRSSFALMPGFVEAWPVKKLAALGAIASSTFYLLTSGAVISAQRAWIMVVIMLVAVLLDRAALTMRNVAIAAIVILIVTPSAVTSPGFQMSFAATAALIAAYGAWAGRERAAGPAVAARERGIVWRWSAVIVGLAATSLIAGLATGIFSAHHFHRMSGLGMIANIAAMPVISVIVMPAATFALITMPFGLDGLPLTVLGWGLETVIAIGHAVAAMGDDVATGQIPGPVTALLTLGLVIAVLTRTWLRALAILPVAMAAAILVLASPRDGLLLLVAEDGRLAALVRSDALATNRPRPSAFIYDQWAAATRRETHVPPVVEDVPEQELADDAAAPDPDGDAASGSTDPPSADPSEPYRIMEAAMATLTAADGLDGFLCRGHRFCIGTLENGAVAALVEEPAFIGPACDYARVVLTPLPLEMRACRSGALLLTGRTLRQTGAIAVYADDAQARPGTAQAEAAQSEPANPPPPQSLRIETALGGALRPWTIHRYYDWRSRSFVEPIESPGE